MIGIHQFYITIKKITMKQKRFLILLITTSLFLSCENKEESIAYNSLLLGHWSNAIYDQDSIIFERVFELPNDKYGISFLNEAEFIERTSGFCGTPPLTFFDRYGSWVLNEGNLKIYDLNTTGFRDEPILWYNYKIIEATATKLILKRELTEQEKDHKNLMELFNEITNIANSTSCLDNSGWNFTAYGSKACGGPQGYIAYSNQIDVVSFLQLVEDYTEEEHQYNIKWGIVSTCDITPQPISIECQNGIPILIF